MITEAGLRRLGEVVPGHVEMIDRWFTGQLDPEQLRTMLEALRTVRDAVRPHAVAGA